MAQQKANPYPNGNFALMLDFMEELITIVGKEKGTVAISEENGGYEDISFDEISTKSLNPPSEAVSATLMVENTSLTLTTSILLRFKENGTPPSENSGFGLGHQDIYELVGKSNLQAFQAINLVTGVALRVQYYQTAQQLPE
ncbi:MAG: hypothetical protein R8G66_06030 [Cytophagales bacterium]|nr:hypothetical protein [Cytophagales bacterium]